MGSSRAGSRGRLPARSHDLRSSSSMSSRYGSGSSGDLWCLSHCHSPWRADKDHQGEQSWLDFVFVVSHMRSVNELREAPSDKFNKTNVILSCSEAAVQFIIEATYWMD